MTTNIDLPTLERRSREVAQALGTPARRARFRALYGFDPSPEELRWLSRWQVARTASRAARSAWSQGRAGYRNVQEADALVEEAAQGFRAVAGIRPIVPTPPK